MSGQGILAALDAEIAEMEAILKGEAAFAKLTALEAIRRLYPDTPRSAPRLARKDLGAKAFALLRAHGKPMRVDAILAALREGGDIHPALDNVRELSQILKATVGLVSRGPYTGWALQDWPRHSPNRPR